MGTFLFNSIIFGPVNSRRLGVSLGINLMPANRKICSFDCIYCECGLNSENNAPTSVLPSFFEVCQKLEEKLKEMVAENQLPDVITFAGNGEPTLHPQFPEIIDVTIKLRDIYCPKARVAVLSNSSRIHVPQIFNALLKVDDNILKLDSANRQTIMLLDQPQGRFDFDETVELLKNFNGKVTIQTLFVKGSYNNIAINNSSEEEVADWLRVISYIEPEQVMVYTIARDTPIETLEKVSSERLHQIACKVRDLGIKVQVSE